MIDLRTICCDPTDYANAIEPSVAGGEKITDNIIHVVAEHNFAHPSTLYTIGYKPVSKHASK